MFGGWGTSQDDEAYDESDRADRRRPLGLSDLLRCGVFMGPGMVFLGLILLVSAAGDPQNRRYRAYTSAVSAWSSAGLEAFSQSFPAGALAGTEPVTLYLQAPGTGDLVPVSLFASTALPPPTFNASRRERSKATSYRSLAFVGTASPYSVAWPSGAASYASVNASGCGVLTAPVTLVSCSDTIGLQEGVDCSADSPPAPAPGQATDENDLLMDLERRRRRGLFGQPERQRPGPQKIEAAPGAASSGGNALARQRKLQQALFSAASPPLADTDPGAVVTQSDEGAAVRDSTAGDAQALSAGWENAGDGEVEKPRPTTCHGCGELTAAVVRCGDASPFRSTFANSAPFLLGAVSPVLPCL